MAACELGKIEFIVKNVAGRKWMGNVDLLSILSFEQRVSQKLRSFAAV